MRYEITIFGEFEVPLGLWMKVDETVEIVNYLESA
jgi:hypothetical protein